MIRAYQTNDLQALIKLIQLNIPKYFAISEEQDFIEYLNYHKEDYFVVVENENIVGSGGINYFPEEQKARISWDMIHPDFQGKGIGKKLTQHRISLLQQNPKIKTIEVRTSQMVYTFYEKMGFKLEKIEKDFWAEGFDLYQMTLKS